jgi:hypothetical protein
MQSSGPVSMQPLASMPASLVAASCGRPGPASRVVPASSRSPASGGVVVPASRMGISVGRSSGSTAALSQLARPSFTTQVSLSGQSSLPRHSAPSDFWSTNVLPRAKPLCTRPRASTMPSFSSRRFSSKT